VTATVQRVLRADCGSCAALCCVAPAFARSVDFAFDKPPGIACRHLAAESFACTVHDRLDGLGMRGCVTYDCFGAGQRVTSETYAGRDWRNHPEIAAGQLRALGVVRDLHEMLWLLDEARSRPASAPLRDALDDAYDATDRLAGGAPDDLDVLDVDLHRATVAPLLHRASALARAGTDGPDHHRADLAGRDLRGADLRGADLRGAVLVGASLVDADLRLADLLGADLRGADITGTDLSTALHLTAFQVGGARGDAATRLPPRLARPARWEVR